MNIIQILHSNNHWMTACDKSLKRGIYVTYLCSCLKNGMVYIVFKIFKYKLGSSVKRTFAQLMLFVVLHVKLGKEAILSPTYAPSPSY